MPFSHHRVGFVADLPLHYDRLFFPVIECQITGDSRSRFTVAQDLYWIAGALPRRLIPFLQCLCQRVSRINRKAHGGQYGAPGVIGGVVEITCDIIIVGCDTGTFSEFGKKILPGLVLHVRESA